MTMAMIYGIVFLIEALIAFQYFEWMFVKPRYTVIKRFVLVLACYVVLFGLFELNILIFNFISFPVFNWIIIKFVYGQKTLSSVFHSVAMSVIMTLSEMVVVAIFFWNQSKSLGSIWWCFDCIISSNIKQVCVFPCDVCNQPIRDETQG